MVSPLFTVVAIALVGSAAAARCEQAKSTSNGYSTSDGFFHFQTSIVAEFTLSCSNGAKGLQLYAIANRKTYIVVAAEETSKYQVSLLLEHAEAGAQTFNIAIYDEDTYAAYLKDESTKPTTTISYYHAGLATKWPINSETLAVFAAFVSVYFAFALKSQLN